MLSRIKFRYSSPPPTAPIPATIDSCTSYYHTVGWQLKVSTALYCTVLYCRVAEDATYLASLNTLKRRKDRSADSAPPDVLPVAPVRMAGGERINSNRPLMTMKPSKRLKLSFAYSLGPSAKSWWGV